MNRFNITVGLLPPGKKPLLASQRKTRWHRLSRVLTAAPVSAHGCLGAAKRGHLFPGSCCAGAAGRRFSTSASSRGPAGVGGRLRPAGNGGGRVRVGVCVCVGGCLHGWVSTIGLAYCQQLAKSHAVTVSTFHVSSVSKFPCKGHGANRRRGRKMGNRFALLLYVQWFRQYLHSWFQLWPCSGNTFFIPVMRHIRKTKIPNNTGEKWTRKRKKCQGDKTEGKHKMKVDTCFFCFLVWHKDHNTVCLCLF